MSLLIVQNLLENARKYNRPDGRVLVRALRDEAGTVRLLLGNTSPDIDPAAHGYIFERFHRGAANENGPGHGLGLNRARTGPAARRPVLGAFGERLDQIRGELPRVPSRPLPR